MDLYTWRQMLNDDAHEPAIQTPPTVDRYVPFEKPWGLKPADLRMYGRSSVKRDRTHTRCWITPDGRILFKADLMRLGERYPAVYFVLRNMKPGDSRVVTYIRPTYAPLDYKPSPICSGTRTWSAPIVGGECVRAEIRCDVFERHI